MGFPCIFYNDFLWLNKDITTTSSTNLSKFAAKLGPRTKHLSNTKGGEPESGSHQTTSPWDDNWMKQLSNIWFTMISLKCFGLSYLFPTMFLQKKTGWWIPTRTIWRYHELGNVQILWDQDFSCPSFYLHTPKKNHPNLQKLGFSCGNVIGNHPLHSQHLTLCVVDFSKFSTFRIFGLFPLVFPRFHLWPWKMPSSPVDTSELQRSSAVTRKIAFPNFWGSLQDVTFSNRPKLQQSLQKFNEPNKLPICPMPFVFQLMENIQ